MQLWEPLALFCFLFRYSNFIVTLNPRDGFCSHLLLLCYLFPMCDRILKCILRYFRHCWTVLGLDFSALVFTWNLENHEIDFTETFRGDILRIWNVVYLFLVFDLIWNSSSINLRFLNAFLGLIFFLQIACSPQQLRIAKMNLAQTLREGLLLRKLSISNNLPNLIFIFSP